MSEKSSQNARAIDCDKLPTLLLVCIHAVIWTLAAWLSTANLDVSGDMVENYIWGLEWQPGYSVHPPLFAWVTGAWFKIFPRADIAYFLLSAVNAGLGIAGVYALARMYLRESSARIACMALAVTPLYTSLAITFNANAILLAIWPWTAYFYVRFVRQMEHKTSINWVNLSLFSIVAALAMLGKYFSGVLITSLIVVSLAWAPWRREIKLIHVLSSIIIGLVVLFPHINWLISNEFSSLKYAQARSSGAGFLALVHFLRFTIAQGLYLSFGILLVLFQIKQGERKRALKLLVVNIVRPRSTELWWLTWTPLIIVAVIAVLHQTEMASVWGLPMWYAFTIWWIKLLDDNSIQWISARLPKAMGVIWLSTLALSVVVGYVSAINHHEDAASPRQALAKIAEEFWHEKTRLPLRVVAGSTNESRSVAFYATNEVRWWSMAAPGMTPWLKWQEVDQQGMLIICTAEDVACHEQANTTNANYQRSVSADRNVYGIQQPARAFDLYLVCPSIDPACQKGK